MDALAPKETSETLDTSTAAKLLCVCISKNWEYLFKQSDIVFRVVEPILWKNTYEQKYLSFIFLAYSATSG